VHPEYRLDGALVHPVSGQVRLLNGIEFFEPSVKKAALIQTVDASDRAPM
jgi:hypothetical protein